MDPELKRKVWARKTNLDVIGAYSKLREKRT